MHNPEADVSDIDRRAAFGLAAAAVAAGGVPRAAPAAAPTDGGDLPQFVYDLDGSAGKVLPGGTAKEATVKQLPISTGLAGVSMRLKPGALRELHWHAIAAEWALVLSGRCRTTVIGPDSTTETNDFGPGDVWYFPRGHGHSIQGIGTDECHFILVFDSGSFSEFGTFSSTDWLGHTPPEVLSKTLGLPAAAFAHWPKKELYITQGKVPPDAPPPNRGVGLRPSPSTHRYPLLSQPPYEVFRGGKEWRVTVNEFPISKTISGVVLELEPGAVRELHWHPNANEWDYVVSGTVRMTLFGSGGRARTETMTPGTVGYVPMGYGHYIENTGATKARVLVAFDNGLYEEISLSTWLAANPAQLVADNFQVPIGDVNKLPDRRVFLAPKDGPG